MAIRIMDDTMTLEIGDCVVATARFSEHAAADGNGAWIVSTHPARLFSRNQAITALVLAERLAIGYGDDDPVRDGVAQGTVPVPDRLIRIMPPCPKSEDLTRPFWRWIRSGSRVLCCAKPCSWSWPAVYARRSWSFVSSAVLWFGCSAGWCS
jgi:hypothetical protein